MGLKLEGSLQGTNLAWLIVKWAMTLRWPSHDAVFDPMTHPGMAISWGVSWFELYVNFLLCTSQYIPARISGSLENVIYTDYLSNEAKILPSDKRSAMAQCTSFQSAVRCVESLLQRRIFPEYIKKAGGKSLHRLGFTGQISGLAIRPLMSRQSETVDAVFQYLRVQPNKKKLRRSVEQFKTFGDITIIPVHEPGPSWTSWTIPQIQTNLEGKMSTCWLLDDFRFPDVHSFWIVAAFLVWKFVVFLNDACNICNWLQVSRSRQYSGYLFIARFPDLPQGPDQMPSVASKSA